jgi:hypothetical protein
VDRRDLSGKEFVLLAGGGCGRARLQGKLKMPIIINFFTNQTQSRLKTQDLLKNEPNRTHLIFGYFGGYGARRLASALVAAPVCHRRPLLGLTSGARRVPLQNWSAAAENIKNAHNYQFFYESNPIAIENTRLAKKRTQSNPFNFRVFRRLWSEAACLCVGCSAGGWAMWIRI